MKNKLMFLTMGVIGSMGMASTFAKFPCEVECIGVVDQQKLRYCGRSITDNPSGNLQVTLEQSISSNETILLFSEEATYVMSDTQWKIEGNNSLLGGKYAGQDVEVVKADLQYKVGNEPTQTAVMICR